MPIVGLCMGAASFLRLCYCFRIRCFGLLHIRFLAYKERLCYFFQAFVNGSTYHENGGTGNA